MSFVEIGRIESSNTNADYDLKASRQNKVSKKTDK